MTTLIVVLAIVALVVIVLAKTATVVPQQSAYVVETLGRYSRTLQAGFHILVPFVDRIAYNHTLKISVLDPSTDPDGWSWPKVRRHDPPVTLWGVPMILDRSS